MQVILQILFLFSIFTTICGQYRAIKPKLVYIDDGCPIGYMKNKAKACVESSGTLIPIPELNGRCPSHYYEVDGKCYRPSGPEDRCPSGYTNRRGMCRPIVNPCPSGYDYAYGRCEPFH